MKKFFARPKWGVFGSIRFRLALWTAGILALILAAFSVFIYTRQSSDLQLRAQTRLSLRAQQIQSGLHTGGDEEGDRERPRLPDLTLPAGSTQNSQEVLALLTPQGDLLQKSGPMDETTVLQLFRAWEGQTGGASQAADFSIPLPQANRPAEDNRYIVLVSPLLADRRITGLVLLGQPLDPDEELPRLLLTLAAGSLATLAFALAGGFWVASRAMAPVRTITRTARGISESDLHRRLRLGKHDEIGELADTFDAMLDRLQAAFNRQRQFTADASHELRTPLTVVNLEADQALARPRTREEYEKTLKVIRSESDRMAFLVNDLLMLARMDAGQTALRPEPLDLSDLAVEVTERLTALARSRQVELVLQELPEARVMGDRQFLSQALSNLIENAIKYAGGDGKQVEIETGMNLTGREKRAWVRVADNGPGIPSEDLPHLFDRFYQVDPARSHDQEGAPESRPGSGLGLSIVQWIVHAHGGSVSVESRLGQGTVFTIDLPASDQV